MPTLLITGAGRGLGLEFAGQYAGEGWRVIGTVRDLAQGAALAKLGRSVEVHSLDVRDRAAIFKLARELEGTAIDVLLCNAGIYGPRDLPFGGIEHQAWHEVFQVNVMGPMACAEAFADHVARSERKAIVVVSSRMGSISGNTNGSAYIYRSSKAALNAVAKNLSIELHGRGITVAAVHPGWVQTDMGGAAATLTPEASVRDLRAVIDGLTLERSGRFWNYDGAELAW